MESNDANPRVNEQNTGKRKYEMLNALEYESHSFISDTVMPVQHIRPELN